MPAHEISMVNRNTLATRLVNFFMAYSLVRPPNGLASRTTPDGCSCGGTGETPSFIAPILAKRTCAQAVEPLSAWRRCRMAAYFSSLRIISNSSIPLCVGKSQRAFHTQMFLHFHFIYYVREAYSKVGSSLRHLPSICQSFPMILLAQL